MAPAGTSELSSPKRAMVLAYHKAGWTYDKIAKQLGVAKSTCYKTVRRHQLYKTLRSLPCSGRPSTLSDRDKCLILCTIKTHRFDTWRQVAEEAGGYTTSQLRRVAYDAGYHRYLACHMPFLSAAARRARVQWAHRNHFRDWTRVIWTDESALHSGEEVIHPRVTRLEGEADLFETMVYTHPNTKSGIMVWGCIAYGKKGPLVRLDLPQLKGKAPKDRKRGGLDAEGYVAQVLEGPLLQFYKDCEKECDKKMLVVEDGAPAHNSKLAAEARTRLGIKRLAHPARSPDLNPIERIWFKLKCKVQHTPGAYKSINALWEATRQAWEELTDEEKKGGTVKVF
ncbi:hypothetical protein NUW54_g10067 [Trametes sanguinea]|uniref:Uncharacterized protein n=1 Tax=Trametes sanguinea TaxID=158606 RepID=A0ACC1P1Q5_9APHY|nr:hypothetical protein NUW54_g10067 [Trametes sanguinea]